MPITVDQIYTHKERFYRNQPNRGINTNRTLKREVFQSEFLAELDTEGHKIMDTTYYPNIFKKIPVLDEKDEPTGQQRIVEIPIERVSIPLQKVILEKHLTHLCGEKIRFIHHNLNPSQNQADTFIKFKHGWEKSNMETAKYEFCQSVKATGDAAFCAVLDNKKFTYRVFSALKGDTLHPIRDFSGKLRIFGRTFTAYDFERCEEVPYLEIWDDKYCTLLSYSTEMNNPQSVTWDSTTYLPTVTDSVDTDGWIVVKKPTVHGFSQIPIEYLKDEGGACWSGVQDLIDKLELALSQLFENNKSYAFRIMVIKGDVEVTGDLKGQARALLFDNPDGDAHFMEKADASSSFELQLHETLKYILMGSFTVLPPEKTSGDLPSVSIKLLYSPAIEQGLNDRNFYNKSIDKIVTLFKEGYAIQEGSASDFNTLDIRGDINIYIHQNDSEVTNNLVMGVTSGFTSIETAQENSMYSSADEMRRLQKQKENDLADERAKITSPDTPTEPNETNIQRKIIAETT